MKLRAIQATIVNGVYVDGAERNFQGEVLRDADPFEVHDDFVVNLAVFEILEGSPAEVIEMDNAGRLKRVKFDPSKHLVNKADTPPKPAATPDESKPPGRRAGAKGTGP